MPAVKKRTEQLIEIISRFGGSRIGVLGDFMLDEYVWGYVTHISPEAPVPVVEAVGESFTLGGAGNALMNVQALKGNPVAFGIVGDDEAADKIVEILGNKTFVGGKYVFADNTRPTTVKKRVIAQSQHVVRVDKESRSPIGEGLQRKILESLHSEVSQLDALIVSDYNKGVVTRQSFDEVFRPCCAARVPVFLDPKAFDLRAVGPVMAITPNEREAERLSGISIHDLETIEKAGRAILDLTGAKHILITRGEQGMALFSATESPVHLPTQARQVYDVTGAGDTVVAVLAMAVVAGASMAEAAQLANLAAGIAVGKVGTATVTPGELIAALDGNWPVDMQGRFRVAPFEHVGERD